ncbi:MULTISPECIES: helix-turn-helix domain-containing protein [Providencia]|uniref:helix-turn-helix domain-containing protein n=1 Tax=Providencia TaxID=586 RepID=UPI001011C602|nr:MULTISPECIES: helix-turn-helix transcriptional regulator [Providencia]ELR5139236.1 helix-turn-helix transcriptional regulator [Providencia rettgeri]QLQ93661.1 helix-turn-helix transcriptional regulator [Providencia rettgeri]RXN69501.1 XRE family transcriptional regulator [Providencia rettgeri]WEB84279.1 helix-turn-helix domain-containing protein [Providencia rettgeri]HCH7934585.1 helix-turn-helix transcriptional regulator [Providencia rettgeri]
MTNTSSLGEKIRLIREAEGLNRKELSELLDISYGSLNNYETKGIQLTESSIVKFTNHPRFEKYTLWLLTGKTNESIGQISPTLSPNGQEDKTSSQSERKIG